MDRFIIVIHSVKMPVGFDKAVKSKGRPLSVMAYVKHSIINVKAETNCLAHALILAIARLTKDPNYDSDRKGCKIRPEVHHFLQTTGSICKMSEGSTKSNNSKTTIQSTEYRGLNCEDIIFEGRVNLKRGLICCMTM